MLLGGSGAGKSTFARVLFERDELAAAGFDVVTAELDLERDELGLVPQRGALFDHLDVAGNLELALRHARGARERRDRGGLARARRPRSRARAPGTPVTRCPAGKRNASRSRACSRAGQAAVPRRAIGRARSHRVRVLARLIREQVARLGISAIVVTHDVALAAGVADRLFLLSLATRRLEPLFADRWPGALEDARPTRLARRWMFDLEATLVDHLAEHGDTPPVPGDTAARAPLYNDASARADLGAVRGRGHRGGARAGAAVAPSARLRDRRAARGRADAAAPAAVLRDRIGADRLHGAVRSARSAARACAPMRCCARSAAAT